MRDALARSLTYHTAAMTPVLTFPMPPVLRSVHAARLAERRAADRPKRRWVRYQPGLDLPTRIDARAGRLVDVSYGGACISVEADEASPASGPAAPAGSPTLELTIPGYGVSVPVEAVWSREGSGRIGLAVRRDGTSDAMWRAFVDAVTAGPGGDDLALAA